MSIGKKNKYHLKVHGGLALVGQLPTPPKSDDPLYFWTNHPTENYAVDLHSFADGQYESPHPISKNSGKWGGAYTGRPSLIKELAPAVQARVSLLNKKSAKHYEGTLRIWWRLFDAFETTHFANGKCPSKILSVADLNELHEVFAHQRGIDIGCFRAFRNLINDTRRLMKLPALLWLAPKSAVPSRELIPDDQARQIKIALKQEWERVRKTWARNDAIREEANRRASNQQPFALDEEGECLLKNWQHFQRIQKKTGLLLPTGEQILDGFDAPRLSRDGLERRVMRSICFPTLEEAEIALHMCLMNSGWNLGTLTNLDAESPFLVAPHPKNQAQLVLSSGVEEEAEATLQASKPRAKGKMQFCTGLVKHTSSPPFIVAAFLKRVAPLREVLNQQYAEAVKVLEQMQSSHADAKIVDAQYLKAQRLREGLRNVWLYVSSKGHVGWLNWSQQGRYRTHGQVKMGSYLCRFIVRLNEKRADHGLSPIPNITPSDFRDIYARWVYKQSGGNILSVMLALGHSRIGSTMGYLENTLFAAENDAHALRFMVHLVGQLEQGRLDLTILAQLVRDGELTPEMETRLTSYRKLMKSRIGTGCTDPRHPPESVAPNHVAGRLCGTHRCLKDCPNAKFLPESLEGIAMRVEELMTMLERLPRETWLRSGFDKELEAGEFLLDTLYPVEDVPSARLKWRKRIESGEHIVPGLGYIGPREFEEIA